MFSQKKMTYLDFDIYSRRISFFFANKEKMGSTFGFLLTILYAIISVILFLIYFVKTIKRDELTASNTTIYSTDIPSIQLNNDLFFLVFGLKHPSQLNRYIDETIYYPKVLYIEKIKIDGEFKEISKISLKVEKCDNIKFEDNYQKMFENYFINNSYCIKNLNLSLIGSLKYDKISFIKIDIYPCVNRTENNNHCKSQNMIDSYLTSTSFSVLAKDIGLNLYNFISPTVPTLQDLYINLDKSMKKDFIIYLGITEIQTDIGLFSYQYKKEKYLRYIKDEQRFYFIDDKYYYSGKEILSVEIKLEENIYFHKRSYTKMQQVFSITGGYMQLIYTIFGLLVLLSKKISMEKRLLNSLFNFNIKERKIILSIEYQKKLDYYSSLDKGNENNFIQYEAKKSKKKSFKRNSVTANLRNFENIQTIKKTDTGQNINKDNRDSKSQNLITKNGIIEIYKKFSKEKKKKGNFGNQSIDRSKINMLNKEDHTNLSVNKNYMKSFNNLNILSTFKEKEKENEAIINFNIFDYYCFRKISKKRAEIELFNFGINFYKKKMDLINFFNIIILTQIMLTQQTDKKQNNLNQKIELSIK